MIKETIGDILKADVEALVNPVNCVGIMGAGLALQFKQMFNENYIEYKKACSEDKVFPGNVLTYITWLDNPKYIINFPTKRHWRDMSTLSDIDAGLVSLTNEIWLRGIKSIAIPKLGCGLGGLDWRIVKPLIIKHLSHLDDIRIIIYEGK